MIMAVVVVMMMMMVMRMRMVMMTMLMIMVMLMTTTATKISNDSIIHTICNTSSLGPSGSCLEAANAARTKKLGGRFSEVAYSGVGGSALENTLHKFVLHTLDFLIVLLLTFFHQAGPRMDQR